MGGTIEDVGMLYRGAPYEVKATLQPRAMENQAEPWILTGKEWQAMCSYVQMLDSKLPELQEIIATSKAAVADRLMISKDKLGEVMTDVGSGDYVTGWRYVNVWSGVGTALENNQPVATLVGKKCETSHEQHGEIEKTGCQVQWRDLG
jgi:hypothetical protein